MQCQMVRSPVNYKLKTTRNLAAWDWLEVLPQHLLREAEEIMRNFSQDIWCVHLVSNPGLPECEARVRRRHSVQFSLHGPGPTRSEGRARFK